MIDIRLQGITPTISYPCYNNYSQTAVKPLGTGQICSFVRCEHCLTTSSFIIQIGYWLQPCHAQLQQSPMMSKVLGMMRQSVWVNMFIGSFCAVEPERKHCKRACWDCLQGFMYSSISMIRHMKYEDFCAQSAVTVPLNGLTLGLR